MFVPHLKSSNICFFLCLLCDSFQKLFTVLWGSGCSMQNIPLLCCQVNPRSFKCLFFFILRICNQRKYGPMVFQFPRVVYFICISKHWDVRGERGKLQQQTSLLSWLAYVDHPGTGEIKGFICTTRDVSVLPLHYSEILRALELCLMLFLSISSMPHVFPQVSLASSTGNIPPFRVSFLFLSQELPWLACLN